LFGTAALTGCREHDEPDASESQANRPRLKLSIAPLPLENVEDAFAFRVTIENLDRDDVFLNLGVTRASGKCEHPDAIKLILTDPGGKSKALRFIKSPGHTHPTGTVDPYIVPLRAASGYFLNLNLREYSATDAEENQLRLVRGKYRLRAELVGTVPESSNAKPLNFWKGKVRSQEITFKIL
jgi:hypothetical protein